MKPDISFLRKKCYELSSENLKLKSENAFLRGKVEVYERFLIDKGLIEGDDHAS